MAEADVLNLADFGASKRDIWRLGYRGDDVEIFQRRLIAHGFTRLQPTAIVDLDTASAVRVLQKHLAVPVSGAIDPDTRAAVDSDETTNGAERIRAAGVEFSTPVVGAALGDALGEEALPVGGAGLLPTSVAQQIQTIESVAEPPPVWKQPIFWIGIGGAALLYYYWTRDTADEADLTEGEEEDEDLPDADEFFAKPKKRRPRALAGPPKKRRPRKKKGLAETAPGPDGAVTPDPNAGADVEMPGEEEAGVGNPPRPRRRKAKAAGKKGKAKGQKRNQKGKRQRRSRKAA